VRGAGGEHVEVHRTERRVDERVDAARRDVVIAVHRAQRHGERLRGRRHALHEVERHVGRIDRDRAEQRRPTALGQDDAVASGDVAYLHLEAGDEAG